MDEYTVRTRGRKVNFNVNMALELVNIMDRIAESEDAKTGEIVVRLIRKGLEVERAEREAKAKA